MLLFFLVLPQLQLCVDDDRGSQGRRNQMGCGGSCPLLPPPDFGSTLKQNFPSIKAFFFFEPSAFRFLDPPTALQEALRAPKHQCHPWSTRLICLNWLLDFFFQICHDHTCNFFPKVSTFCSLVPVLIDVFTHFALDRIEF